MGLRSLWMKRAGSYCVCVSFYRCIDRSTRCETPTKAGGAARPLSHRRPCFIPCPRLSAFGSRDSGLIQCLRPGSRNGTRPGFDADHSDIAWCLMRWFIVTTPTLLFYSGPDLYFIVFRTNSKNLIVHPWN